MFALAVGGNVFYGLQIFIKSTAPDFLLKSVPWLVGSLGILVFDLIVSLKITFIALLKLFMKII